MQFGTEDNSPVRKENYGCEFRISEACVIDYSVGSQTHGSVEEKTLSVDFALFDACKMKSVLDQRHDSPTRQFDSPLHQNRLLNRIEKISSLTKFIQIVKMERERSDGNRPYDKLF